MQDKRKSTMSHSKHSQRLSFKLDEIEEVDEDTKYKNTVIVDFIKQLNNNAKCKSDNLINLFQVLDEFELYNVISELHCIKDIEVQHHKEDIL